MARRGRPTDDPKGKLLAVRLANRHLDLLRRRAHQERITLSEALRRYLDEIASGPKKLSAPADGRDVRSPHRR